MKPFKIKAYLRTPIVLPPFGIALDGLLASELRAEQVAEKNLATGSLLDGGLRTEDVFRWELPLRACEHGSRPHWEATTSLLADIPRDAHVHSQRIYSQFSHPLAEASPQVVLPERLDLKSGRLKSKAITVPTLTVPYVSWLGIGDLLQVKELLNNVTHIGGRRHIGYGEVAAWEFVQLPSKGEAVDWGFTHVHDGQLAQIMPIECGERTGVEYMVGDGNISPPYFKVDTYEPCAFPPHYLQLVEQVSDTCYRE